MEFNLKDFKFYTYMTESFGQMIEKLSRKEIDFLKQMIEGLMKAYKEAKKEYGGPSVAHHFHERIDKQTATIVKRAEKEGRTISCGKGCGFCCFQRVDITSDEAVLINGIAKEEKIEIDKNVLAKQAMCKDHKDHIALPVNVRKCMFLDKDMSCKIYEYRPGSCRTVLVISEPEKCNTETHKKGKITRLNHISAEGELVATHMAAKETGGMAEMLIKYRQK